MAFFYPKLRTLLYTILLYLKTFISKNYLVEGSFVYYGKGDSYLYVIPVTDDCIDLDKPGYKVKLVEKPEF